MYHVQWKILDNLDDQIQNYNLNQIDTDLHSVQTPLVLVMFWRLVKEHLALIINVFILPSVTAETFLYGVYFNFRSSEYKNRLATPIFIIPH